MNWSWSWVAVLISQMKTALNFYTKRINILWPFDGWQAAVLNEADFMISIGSVNIMVNLTTYSYAMAQMHEVLLCSVYTEPSAVTTSYCHYEVLRQ